MMAASHSEIEVKIAVESRDAGERRVLDAGFAVRAPRIFERNTVYDSIGLRFRGEGKVLRLREAGQVATLTLKGRATNGLHKVREEIETRVENPAAIERVLQELELAPMFRYEKYRTEYTRGSGGVVMLDETPIGTFLEIEGAPGWIDETAREMGFSEADYITLSYGALYAEHCRSRGITPSHMVFGGER